jgi:ribosome-associated protein
VDDLHVTDTLTIPGSELEERFTTSGGPGGQHANRSATRVVLTFDIGRSAALDATQRRRLLESLGSSAPSGVLSVTSEESRSQWRNRHLARRRLAESLREGLRPPRRRIPTKPTRASRRRRLERKRARGETKRLRRRPEPE